MTQEKTYSLAQFPAHRVVMACNAWKKDRAERIEARKEKLIAEVMNPTKHWFGLVTRQLTREQAIERLSNSDDRWVLPEFVVIENYMSYWAGKVDELRILAKHSKDSVSVDAELFERIAPFYYGGVE